MVAATLVPSAARPRQHLEVHADGDKTQTEVVNSADSEARWLKKGNKSYFGYRGYVSADEAEGYIEHIHVTPANEAETRQFETVIKHLHRVNEVLTDKGFASQHNRNLLEQQGMKDGISHKASRGNPLTYAQRQTNLLIVRRRFRVEQAFGTLKRRFHFARARYFGVAKVKMQMVLAAIGLNLLKAQRKLEKGCAIYAT